MLTPRDYQVTAARDIWRHLIIERAGSCVLQAPTGSGKTATGAFVVKKMLEHQGIKTLCIAHRREIVTQTARRLRDDGLSTGIIMSGEMYTPNRDIQVASIDTLDAWVKNGKIEVPDAGMVWSDEAHRVMGTRWSRVLEAYRERGAMLFGTTATPIRTDGVGLGQMFSTMVRTPGIQWHIDHGFLVPVTYRIGIVPDTSGVKLVAGDYNQAQLEAVMKQKLLIGNVVENWLHHAKGRPTMVFCSGVEHSKALVDEFAAAGVVAVHIDGHTPQEVRDDIAMKLGMRTVDVVCNAQVYVEGTDIPCVSCIVLAQPTKSIGKFLQMAGRGLRPDPYSGKRDMMLLDHAGAVYAHGVIEMERDWHLTEGKEMLEKHLSERKKEKVQFTCSVCGTLHTGAVCPTCHAAVKFTGAARDFLPAMLVDMSQGEFDKLMAPKPIPKKKKNEYTMQDKRDFYAQLVGYAVERGKLNGWVAHTYRDKFGVWPTNMDGVRSKPPGDEVRSFIRHKNIAFAKSRAREAARG